MTSDRASRLRAPELASPDPWHPSWMPRAILGYAVVSTVILAGYLGSGSVGDGTPWLVANQLLSLVAFAGGALTSRPGFRRDWFLMLGAVTVWVVGNLLAVSGLGSDNSFDQWQISVTISAVAFALMTTGVHRLARRDGYIRGASVKLDALLLLLSIVLEWWVLAGKDLEARHAALGPGVFVAGLIPLGDGVLLVAVAALMSSRSAHALSSKVLVVACLCGLAGDLGFARVAISHGSSVQMWIPAVWMAQFMMLGLAALASGQASVQPATRISPVAGYLALAAVVTPAILGLYAAGKPADGVRLGSRTWLVLVLGTGLLSLLHALRERGQTRTIHAQAADMERTARTDHLTQLPNRRAGDRILDNSIAAVRSTDVPLLGVVLLDLDHFKTFNDTFGHQQGDQLLRTAAIAWSSAIAGLGTIFRYGGEEFVIILPHTAREDAESIVSTLRLATPRNQTFSAGLAMLRPEDDMVSLVGRADRALYAAKDAGRACTRTDVDEPATPKAAVLPVAQGPVTVPETVADPVAPTDDARPASDPALPAVQVPRPGLTRADA